MKLVQLRNLLAIAEQGSVRAAARHLGVAQSALTRSIQELERELDVALFERRAKGIRLTDTGRHFLIRAQSIHNEVRRAQEEIEQLRGQTTGVIHLGLSSVSQIALFPYAAKAFRARYPDVVLHIRDGLYPTMEPYLKNSTLDMYIGPILNHRSAPDLSVEKLLDNPRGIICRKGHPLAKAKSLSELADAEWVTTSVTFKAEEELGPLFAQHDLPNPRLILRAHSALSFVTAMVSSDALAMLPVQFAELTMGGAALEVIQIAEPLPEPPLCLVRRNDILPTPAAEYFCDMIRRASGHIEQERNAAKVAS
ncbi:LysR substrate-binding domain-containing protein [Pusillimonas sp.]|uniref:LysR substrate-binding domain-containing protein n=1 Tax=Pusillimonas sp. TaxID=3040095 RepID=UPI0037C84C12